MAVATGIPLYVAEGKTIALVDAGQSWILLQVELGLGRQSGAGDELRELEKLSEMVKEVANVLAS